MELPPDLHDRLLEAAIAHSQPLSAEIVRRLQKSLEEEDRRVGSTDPDLLDLQDAIDNLRAQAERVLQRMTHGMPPSRDRLRPDS